MTKAINNLTDKELIRETIENADQRAFGELYDRYSHRVYNKCISFTNSKSEAEDLTHDIFLKVFLKLSTFKQNSSFYTWLYSITYHTCIDYTRGKSSNRQGIVLSVEEIEEQRVKAFHSNSEDDLLQMKVEYLKKVLETLEPDDKMILLMKYQDDMSISEIQEVFDIGESAAKMRLLRARERAVAIYNILLKNN
ncbi:RNA polymerase subunit sigma-70 [Aliifodinibius salipaludis]|uniref:RNA polymerase subunit sigma-70 n=1 Tax=Fodinibius salipaludis TaxID=2032627 RepID=A0A2A2G771_9BACT|nr:RNA polymerase sigma factor [Aliifodinibius salipaludis]PAU92663.1 RNA polymerase subunit sigma-70 [Aliifodinibius salipaludis]